jgi:dolichol kinase
VVWRLPHPAGATVLAGAAFLALSVELARRRSPGFARRFERAVGSMLRDREAHRLTGATTLALGYTVAATAFPGWPAVAAILLTGAADPAGALVGRRFGRARWPGGKSLEGSAAFFAVALLVLLAVPGIGVVAAAAVALVVTVAEAPTLSLDDNFYLPVIAAAAVRIAASLFGLGGFS